MLIAWGRLCSLMPKVSACSLEGLGFIPRREVQVLFIPHFAIHCRSAYMQLCRIVSLKCCGLLKKLHLQICICAVVKQNYFKSCGLEAVDFWKKVLVADMQLRNKILFKIWRKCSCGSPSFKLRSCDCGHKRKYCTVCVCPTLTSITCFLTGCVYGFRFNYICGWVTRC